MPTFSYAQAAKGLVSSTSAQQQSEKFDKSSASPADEQSAGVAGGSDISGEPMSASFSVNGLNSVIEKQTDPAPGKHILSASSSPSIATASTGTIPKEDDMSLTPNGSSDSTWDKQSQASLTIERSHVREGAEDDSSEKGTEKSIASVKELKPAPIPTVNIWQQRLEAQEAKARASAALKPGVSSNDPSPKPPPTVQGSSSRPDGSKGGNRQKPLDSLGDKKKSGEASKKTGSRTHRPTTDADPTESIPPVANSALWPTPEFARDEGQRKVQGKVEKTEKVDKEKPLSSRTHGKEKWMPVPYVPTAVFSTPLPPAARRGGRTARGGRDASAHNASHTGEKNHASSKTGERRFANDSKSKSNGVDGSHNDEGQDSKSQNVEEIHRQYSANTQRSSNLESSSQQRYDAKSVGKLLDATNLPYSPTLKLHGESQSHSRYAQTAERRFENGPRSADPYKEPISFASRDRDFGRDRDYQRENYRGESRSERGRGGYRGRGGHPSYTSPQNIVYSAPLPQHPFPAPKPFAYNGERQRMPQASAQNGAQSGSRMGLRSPSMPAPAIYAAAPYPIQTDLTSLYGYPQIHPGPMTAIPYQPYMEQYSLMGMISMQLEYYFSVDNLCKDLFLRRHMDSQGFVLLTVIAAFKRIKSLTEDMDLLRLVCRQLKTVEYRPGEDGLDRIRKKEKWEQWVLSMEARDPSAQTEGPPAATSSSFPQFDNFNENGMTSQQDGYPHITNGAAQPCSETLPHFAAPLSDTVNNDTSAHSIKLSSAAPEFSPQAPVVSANEKARERDAVAENVFPDEQIGNLVIVVRKPGAPSPTQSPILGPSSSSFSNGSVDNCKAAHGQLSAGNILPPPRQDSSTRSDRFSVDTERLKRVTDKLTKSFSTNTLPEKTRNPSPTFWINSKNSPIKSPQTDLIHESYTVFRKQALDKWLSKSSGELPVDMDVLYQFWSHFLVRNFNSRMYNEFRNLAFDDVSSRHSTSGIHYLIKFYGNTLLRNKIIADGLAKDFLDLVQSEANAKERPAFRRLRSVWRNGAFNLKSRKKIDELIDENLRSQLDHYSRV
ncbi:hypothetical protein LOZ36_004808 [Ophidiomyces ophidiicola]|nr:hypothetical protein LOZ36_004808 [Ophidiomyces ophidiicola]